MCKWMTKRYQNKCKRFYIKTCCSTRCTLALIFKLYYALGIYKNSHQYLDTCNKRDDPPSPYLYKLWFRYKMFLYADSSSDNLNLMKSIGQTMNHEKCYKQRFILTFPIFPLNGINFQSNAFERVITQCKRTFLIVRGHCTTVNTILRL